MGGASEARKNTSVARISLYFKSAKKNKAIYVIMYMKPLAPDRLKSERIMKLLRMDGLTDASMDVRTDRRTKGWADGRMEGRTDFHTPL